MSDTDRCRYAEKRTFGTRDAARDGALEIRIRCELEHREYQPLYPYHCPDEDHWHLSHYQQGHRVCGVCRQKAPAWKGWYWIMARHLYHGRPCPGEGKRAGDDPQKKETP